MRNTSKNRCRGVILIEILMVLGFLVIISSFALPSMSNATSSATMHAASENLEFSIRSARNTARMSESSVSMNILAAEPDQQGQRITFSVSGSDLNAPGQSGLQDDRLPADIILVSDYSSYEFDSRGIVKNPGVIILVSRTDESLTTSFTVA